MELTTQCALALQLAENPDLIKDSEKYLFFLEQCTITVFRGQKFFSETLWTATSDEANKADDGVSSPMEPFVSFASRDEEKLMIVKAIKAFHKSGLSSHLALFCSTEYHHHAALFIQELLQSLSGNSKEWFRELQVASLEAALALMRVLSVKVVRFCLPGVTSAAARYMQRAHHGKDSAIVSVRAMDLLSLCLRRCFTEDPDSEWICVTSFHLSRSLQAVMSADAVVHRHYDFRVLNRCRVLLKEMVSLPVLSPEKDSGLFRVLLGGFLVVDNICHIQEMGVAQEVPEEVEIHEKHSCHPTSSSVTFSSFHYEKIDGTPFQQVQEEDKGMWAANSESVFAVRCQDQVIHQRIADLLRELCGVALLHAATTVLRFPFLRVILLRCAFDEKQYSLFNGLIRRCVRFIAVEFRPEDFYTFRFPRLHPVGVVDEFIETLSHALAGTPFADAGVVKESNFHTSGNWSTEMSASLLVDADGYTAGEQLTNTLLEEAQEILQDWDMYTLHPATVYFIGRLITWQFKPIPAYFQPYYFSIKESAYPYPVDFIDCAVLEQLWSVIGLSHLWNIEEDEELCNVQQTNHRRLMAATIIRVLDLVAVDVMEPATKIQGDASLQESGRRAFDRLCAVTLYPIMEKVGVAGFVHETALHCLDSYAVASGEKTPFGFFSRVSDYIVDAASRAIKRCYLRNKATSVLAGSLRFLGHLLSSPKETSSGTSPRALPFLFSSSREKTSSKESTSGGALGDDPSQRGEEAELSFSGVPSWWFASSRAMPLAQVVQRRLSSFFMSPLTQTWNEFFSLGLEEASEKGTRTEKMASLPSSACEGYATTVCATFMGVLIDLVARALADVQAEDESGEVGEVEGAGIKGLLLLLRDAMDIAALLNYSTFQEVFPEENDRLTTSANDAVKQLQGVVLYAMKVVQTFALGGTLAQGVGQVAVEVVIRGFTCCLTTTLATDGLARRMVSLTEEKKGSRDEEMEHTVEKQEGDRGPKVSVELNGEGKKEKEEQVSVRAQDTAPSWSARSVPLTVPWLPVLSEEEKRKHASKLLGVSPVGICLPRSLLPFVYQTYLPLVALLQEPISRFVTAASTAGGRSRVEQRELKEVRVTDALSAALTGLHSLLLLAQDFLQHRYVTDVLPVVMVWYERTLLPAIPTPTEIKAKERILDFVRILKELCPSASAKNNPRRADEDLEETQKCGQVDALVSAVEVSVNAYHRLRETRRGASSALGMQQRSSLLSFDSACPVLPKDRKNDQGEKVFLTRDDLYIIGSETK